MRETEKEYTDEEKNESEKVWKDLYPNYGSAADSLPCCFLFCHSEAAGPKKLSPVDNLRGKDPSLTLRMTGKIKRTLRISQRPFDSLKALN